MHEKYRHTEHILLEQVPVQWKTVRLKDLTKVISKGTTPSTEGFEFTDNGVRFIKAENINNTKGVSPMPAFYISEEANKALKRSKLKIDDLLIVIAGATIGKIGVLTPEFYPANTNQAVCFIRLKDKAYKGFLFYSFISYFIEQYIWYSVVQSAQPNLGMNILGNFILFLPSDKDEIEGIVNYLDRKVNAIDSRLNLLEKKIDYYKELSRSLINDAVCKGLNKDVPLKDSGIEWIGEIPKHWQVKRLKDVGYLYSGLSGKTGEHFNQEVSDNSQHYIPFTNIANNKYINHEDLHTVLMDENERQNKVKKNDLFFLMSSEGFADIGKSALLIEDVKDTYLNSFCKGYRITKKTVVPKYLNYLLNSPAFRDKFIVQGKGFTRINLKMEKVSDFEFVIPPVEEQTAIAEHLDKKTTTIDAIVANIKLQIDSLKELRKTLINDVVTGKLKVTE